jgi:hypothetical protein
MRTSSYPIYHHRRPRNLYYCQGEKARTLHELGRALLLRWPQIMTTSTRVGPVRDAATDEIETVLVRGPVADFAATTIGHLLQLGGGDVDPMHRPPEFGLHEHSWMIK